MYTCLHCGHQQDHFIEHCLVCGEPYAGRTIQIDRSELKRLIETLPKGANVMHEQSKLILEIEGQQIPVSFDQTVLLGRKAPKPNGVTLVDLDRFDGYQAGVSRRHAELRRFPDNRLTVTDLSSANGTYVNGRKLVPLQLYPLHDGDQVFLGRLGLYVHYDPETKVVR